MKEEEERRGQYKESGGDAGDIGIEPGEGITRCQGKVIQEGRSGHL